MAEITNIRPSFGKYIGQTKPGVVETVAKSGMGRPSGWTGGCSPDQGLQESAPLEWGLWWWGAGSGQRLNLSYALQGLGRPEPHGR